MTCEPFYTIKMVPYAKQFVISEVGREVDLPPGWMSQHGQRWTVHHAPDLSITARGACTLIGYAIDPSRPVDADGALVDRLAAASGRAAIIDLASALGGRWALLVDTDADAFLLTDPCGLRQVCYTDATHAEHFCASTPHTALQCYPIQEDPRARAEFLDTPYVANDPEFWWPGDSTAFRGVRHLLPNHVLDLRTREVARYGPALVRENQDADATLRRAAQLMRDAMSAIASRGETALPLTAGWDSRVALAASLAAGMRPWLYTHRRADMRAQHQDLRIPPRLAALCQLPHTIVDAADVAPAEFADEFRRQHAVAAAAIVQTAWALSRQFPNGRITLSGHCSEITRPLGGWDRCDVTAEFLADLHGMPHTPFVLDSLQGWLGDAAPTADAVGMSLEDLFYWEQRVGRWAAAAQAQWDCIYERFTVYNNRQWLALMLSLPLSWRLPPYPAHRRLLSLLAPALATVVVNPDDAPPSLPKRLLGKVRRLLQGRPGTNGNR